MQVRSSHQVLTIKAGQENCISGWVQRNRRELSNEGRRDAPVTYDAFTSDPFRHAFTSGFTSCRR